MRKAISTPIAAPQKFGALAPEAIERIDHSDACHSAGAANYVYETKMQSLRKQFDQEASKIRAEYLNAIGALNGAGELD